MWNGAIVVVVVVIIALTFSIFQMESNRVNKRGMKGGEKGKRRGGWYDDSFP